MTPKPTALLELLALVLVFWALRVGTGQVFYDAVPEAVYDHPSIAVGLLGHPLGLAVSLASLLPILARAALRWSAFEGGVALHWAAGGAVAVLAWSFTTYGFNHYYGHAHLVDRAMLLGLGVASLRNAAWLPAFVVWFLVLLSQFAHPMGMVRFPTIELRLARDVLLAIAGFVCLRSAGGLVRRGAASRPPDARMAVLFLLSLVAAYYVFPAIDKVRISPSGTEWVLDNDLSFLLVEASRHGWLHGWSPETFEALRRAISMSSPLLLGGALLLEFAALFLLASRRMALGLILALGAFHAATALISGYFFWKWLVVEACIAAGLWRLSEADARALFSRPSLIASMVVILAAGVYAKPTLLAWFERSYDYYFRFELVGDDGKVYSTDPSVFEPYTISFAYDRFNYLLPRLALRGQKNYWASFMLRRGGPEGVERVRARYGKPFWDDEAEAALDRYLVRSFQDRNRRGDALGWFAWLRPPVFQIRWVNRDPNPYEGQVAVRAVRVRYVEEYFDGARVVALRDQVVHEVRIGGGGAVDTPGAGRPE